MNHTPQELAFFAQCHAAHVARHGGIDREDAAKAAAADRMDDRTPVVHTLSNGVRISDEGSLLMRRILG